MLIYNTTFHVDMSDARNFVIYLHEIYIPAVSASGELKNPRLTRILNHKEEQSECFSLQFETESSGSLHKWFSSQGNKLNQDMLTTFENRIVGFPTLMEVIE